MKILYSWGNIDQDMMHTELNELRMARFNIISVNHAKELQLKRSLLPHEIYRIYKKRGDFYAKIKDLAKMCDIFLVTDNVYPNKFVAELKNLRTYTVFYCGDDPYGSDLKSKPYVSAFDFAFSGAVNFDKQTTMTEKYLEWGAKRADFWPQGVYSNRYDLSLTKESIYNKVRKTDLVFVGNPQNKVARLFAIKMAYPQMALFGYSFDFKGLLRTYRDILQRKPDWRDLSLFDTRLISFFIKTRALPKAAQIPLYQDSKIGINIHQSSGPVNYRLYELPANGVMQICDCKEGLGRIFELDKEVVAYETIKEAIELIDYYLEHDEERKKIAAAGFRRVMRDYKRLDTFKQALEKIKQGMLEEGFERFKDGTEICVNKTLLRRNRGDRV